MMKRKLKLLTIMTIILAATLVMVATQSASAADETFKYKFKGKVYLRNKANTKWILQESKSVKIKITAHFSCPEASKPFGLYHFYKKMTDKTTNSDGEYYRKFELLKGEGYEVYKYKIEAYMYLSSKIVNSGGYRYTYTYSGERDYSWRDYGVGTNTKNIYLYRVTSIYKEPSNHF